MKATGIVRNVDALGRVVIPMELRKTLGIGEQDPLEIFVDGDQVIFRKYAHGCVLCGGLDQLHLTKNAKLVCQSCVDSFVVAREFNKAI